MADNCKNCGTELKGKYCFHCGQKQIFPKERKLRHLLFDFFHHFTHLDGKFLKTLRNIFFRPGKVTRDIADGITVPHFKLSALFLVGTIIYFLLPNSFIVSTSMNNDFKKQTEISEYHQWKEKIVKKKIKNNLTTREALAAKYDQRQHDFGKLLTLILIPLLIPVLWIINLLVRLFNPDHHITTYDLGVASLEINSIFLYGFFILTGILIRAIGLIIPNQNVLGAGFGIMAALIFMLIFLFFKRAYRINWWQAFVCLLLLIGGYTLINNIYGLISFMIFI